METHQIFQLLLGYKKRGFGKDMYNGFGGKVEPGESVSEAAHRELKVGHTSLSFKRKSRHLHQRLHGRKKPVLKRL